MTGIDEVSTDVLIVGAGLSGIGAGAHLVRDYPGKTFLILEARDAIGGTWDLFRYPGIRSDSDMYTMGYKFKPWTDRKSIAAGGTILNYIRATAAEYGLVDRIRFGERAVNAEWSSTEQRWTVKTRAGDGLASVIKAKFLLCCSGYYRYDAGYSPEFPGVDQFQGRIVHPQHWPEDLDYAGRKVVIIGSGATAVTLLPNMAKAAEHVTMLQRSPSYIAAVPGVDSFALRVRKILPPEQAYALVRFKRRTLGKVFYTLCRKAPDMMTRQLRKSAMTYLPADFDYETHLQPRYRPWDQRLCASPDGDFFTAIADGSASIATGQIETFTPTGIKLTTGEEIAADVVVTATGLNIQMLGGMDLLVDGKRVDVGSRYTYKGAMLSDVPNFSFAFGYTNASWTLKIELVFDYLVRLWRYMDAHDLAVATPRPPAYVVGSDDPLLDLQSGYIQRAIDLLPKQGPRTPWRLYQNYRRDAKLLRHSSIAGDGLEFVPTRAPKAGDRSLAGAGIDHV